MAAKCSFGLKKLNCRKHYTGCIRDSHDPRDFVREYGGHEIPSMDEHPLVDLRGHVGHVYDQGDLNSCTANVVCAAYEIVLSKQAMMMNQTNYIFDSSRLFLYYNSRGYHPDITIDSGATLRNSLKVSRSFGICHESFWPYDVLKFAKKPSSACYNDAMGNNVVQFESLQQDIDQFRACLKEGFPFAFGFEIYDESFDSMIEGVMPMPSDEEIQSTPEPETHAALAVGYDDNTERVTVLNSWGESFGDKGYFYMPYRYICHPIRAYGFWKIDKVTERELYNL